MVVAVEVDVLLNTAVRLEFAEVAVVTGGSEESVIKAPVAVPFRESEDGVMIVGKGLLVEGAD